MRATQYYPVIQTDDVEGTAEFYKTHFRFRAAFDCGWYVHLQSSEDDTVNLGIVRHDHDTVPEASRGTKAAGFLLNFETDDVDAEYERALAAGLGIHVPLRDEPFGQRHFITADPNGILIDIVKPIPPSPEFLAHYDPQVAGALAGGKGQ